MGVEADNYTPIRRFRVKHGLSQPALGRLLGLHPATIRNLEKLKAPKRWLLLALAGLEAELSSGKSE